jgi:hypothetical protein
MGATSKVLAVAVIGLAVTGCALTRQAEQRREVAQRAADDSRCRSYGFKTDADLARYSPARISISSSLLEKAMMSQKSPFLNSPNLNSKHR